MVILYNLFPARKSQIFLVTHVYVIASEVTEVTRTRTYRSISNVMFEKRHFVESVCSLDQNTAEISL